MRIHYQTGIATLIQFITGVALTFISAVASIFNGCRNHPVADCASNTLVSLVLVIFAAVVLAAIAIFGYIAQERRSRQLALILIAIEAAAAIIYLFDAKQSPGLVDRMTNLVSFLVAGWVGVIAFGLARSNGRRIVTVERRHGVKR